MEKSLVLAEVAQYRVSFRFLFTRRTLIPFRFLRPGALLFGALERGENRKAMSEKRARARAISSRSDEAINGRGIEGKKGE